MSDDSKPRPGVNRPVRNPPADTQKNAADRLQVAVSLRANVALTPQIPRTRGNVVVIDDWVRGMSKGYAGRAHSPEHKATIERWLMRMRERGPRDDFPG